MRMADKAAQPLISVGFVLANNFTLSALSLFIDALRLAADEGDLSRPIRCRWTVMAAKPEPVRASCGLMVNRTSGLEDPRQFQYIVVVGGLLHAGRQVDNETERYLREAARLGVPLIGVCTGSFILARAGLMEGYRCCVSWYHYRDFLEEFPDHHPVADRLFMVDRDRITCSGGSGVADLAAFLIERHLGRAVAQKSLHVLLLHRARLGSDAQPRPPMEGDSADERVGRALLLMEQNMTNPLPIATIATRLNLSTRQLERLFHAALGERPAIIYRRLRLRYARWLLENTERTITDIAIETGFSDSAHFSRQFKDFFAATPSGARSGHARQLGEDAPNMRLTAHPRAGISADVRVFD
jgi:transcriptional regulator GlxA family with amidase domain